MKTKETHSPGVAKRSQISEKDDRRPAAMIPTRTRGVALILVLSLIVLATVLVVAFMSAVMSSGVGERAAASEASASQLASSAVQLVEGTITNATEPTTDTTVAWACQPGMIRTYGAGGSASSDPLAYYKLYSSDNMVISGKTACNQFTDPSQSNSLYQEIPQQWDKTPALYADLNAPLIVQSTTTGGASQLIFPIVDPRAQDLGVEGFSTSAAASATGLPDGVVPVTGAARRHSGGPHQVHRSARLPMPVRWMYVQRDGTMTVPSSGNATSASFSGTAAQFAANPIVGRVAFWTDDEDAKINVNTASEGTYEDTPISNSGTSSDVFSYPQTAGLGDYVLARVPGVQHEYQRYPGHPATTCLSSVFGGVLSGLSRGDSGGTEGIVHRITDVVPRITDIAAASTSSGVSSLGGTQSLSDSGGVASPLVTDVDRLYASLDEFQFAAPGSGAASSTRTAQYLGALSGTTAQSTEQNLVDTCRFFLTAHSKSPELNMFGLPRVAMWPLWDTAQNGSLTPFDAEILHCSTIATQPTISSTGQAVPADPHAFAFFRANALSATADFPLSGTLPAGGTGVQRNRGVYGYLHTLMGRSVPGYGQSFAAKYANGSPADSDQILTEIFDYIRSTNLADNSVSAGPSGTVTAVPYTGSYGSSPSANQGKNGSSPGQVIPIQIPASSAVGGGTQGFGRIATVSEMLLVLSKVDDRKIVTAMPGGTNYVSKITVTGSGIGNVDPTKQTAVEWCLIPKLSSPMCGYVGLSNDIRLAFSSDPNNPLSINGQAVNLSTSPNVYDTGRISVSGRDAVIGGNIGLMSMIETAGSPNTGSPSDSMYPTGLVLVNGVSGNSPPTVSPAPGNTMTISGGIVVKLYSPAGSSAVPGPLLQTYTMDFPSMTVPIPQVYTTGSTAYGWYGTFRTRYPAYVPTTSGTTSTAVFSYPATANKGDLNGTNGRFSNGYKNFIGGNSTYSTPNNVGTDIVRSLVPTGAATGGASILGDIRVVATSPTPPTSLWQPTLTSSGALPTSTTYAADSAEMGTLIYSPGDAHGQLSPQISVGYQYPPQVPPLPAGTAAVSMPGGLPADWDNAPGLMTDGPWINKPDEGMTESGTIVPYIGGYETMTHSGAPLTTQFSPNRQVSSPVMFGSLSTGSDHPWRTLLFRPAKLPGYQGGYPHPGNASPGTVVPDHVLLDLFWMPIVEPYGISEPFATSGKINLNTQIAPFTYITRTTGMNAVLKAVMITALNPDAGGTTGSGKFVKIPSYKWDTSNTSNNSAVKTRYPIDATATLGQLTAAADTTAAYPEFLRSSHTAATPNFFVSGSQICDVPLVPTGAGSLATFWRQNSLTGDNSLERPYSMIYPRVTTKSNIFTVHVMAQSLKKIATDPGQNVWNEGRDLITSEYRGAYTIEKYFDPNKDDITTDAAGTVPSPATMDNAISSTAAVRNTKWRLLSVKRFGQ